MFRSAFSLAIVFLHPCHSTAFSISVATPRSFAVFPDKKENVSLSSSPLSPQTAVPNVTTQQPLRARHHIHWANVIIFCSLQSACQQQGIVIITYCPCRTIVSLSLSPLLSLSLSPPPFLTPLSPISLSLPSFSPSLFPLFLSLPLPLYPSLPLSLSLSLSPSLSLPLCPISLLSTEGESILKKIGGSH